MSNNGGGRASNDSRNDNFKRPYWRSPATQGNGGRYDKQRRQDNRHHGSQNQHNNRGGTGSGGAGQLFQDNQGRNHGHYGSNDNQGRNHGHYGSNDRNRRLNQPVEDVKIAAKPTPATSSDAGEVVESTSARLPAFSHPKTVVKPWEDMTLAEKVKDQLPDEEGLPALEYPLDFETRERNAVEDTTDWVLDEAKRDASESEPDRDSDASSHDSPCMVDLDMVSTTNNAMLQNKLKFLKALPNCVVLNLGFHAHVLFTGMDEWCYCPCSTKLKSWRLRFDIRDLEPCSSSKKFSPHGLMCHLDTMKNGRNPHPVHAMIDKYLRFLYKNYWHDGHTRMDHKAMYNVGSPESRIVTSMEARKMHSFVGALQEQLDQERGRAMEAEKKAEKRAEHMKCIEKTNNNLHKKLKAEKRLRERLSLGPALSKVSMSKRQVQRYGKQIDGVLVFVRNSLLGKESASLATMGISVEPHFNLHACFEKWRTNPTMSASMTLFGPVDTSDLRAWLLPWHVQFSAVGELKLDQEAEAGKDGVLAVDGGGPTREFLSQVWFQLGDLVASTQPGDNKATFLFERADRFIVPQSDEKFGDKLEKDVELKEVVHSYYRAFGRMMLYCLWTKNMVASHVLPTLYRNYLFGIDPMSEEYVIETLLEDVLEMMNSYNLTSEESEEFVSSFGKTFGNGDEPPEEDENAHSIFRIAVHNQYIDGRKIALEAIKEGITLNGLIDVSLLFGTVPTEALSNILFSSASIITVDDILAVMVPKYDDDDQLRKQYLENQKLVVRRIRSASGTETCEGLLPEYLRARACSDKDFPRRFVCWITGLMYMPKRDSGGRELTITVEFNRVDDNFKDSASLPVVHTCELTVYVSELNESVPITTLAHTYLLPNLRGRKLPSQAYDGNMELLEQKFDKSLELTTGAFDMQ